MIAAVIFIGMGLFDTVTAQEPDDQRFIQGPGRLKVDILDAGAIPNLGGFQQPGDWPLMSNGCLSSPFSGSTRQF